jgi:hypothetical protein
VRKRKQWNGRIYLGRDENGKQLFHWVGRYRTKAERADALADERTRLKEEGCDCPACVAAGRFPVAPIIQKLRRSAKKREPQALVRPPGGREPRRAPKDHERRAGWIRRISIGACGWVCPARNPMAGSKTVPRGPQVRRLSAVARQQPEGARESRVVLLLF